MQTSLTNHYWDRKTLISLHAVLEFPNHRDLERNATLPLALTYPIISGTPQLRRFSDMVRNRVHTPVPTELPSCLSTPPRPRLRDALIVKSREYEPKSLLLDLVLNFELAKTTEVSKQPIFVSTPGSSGFELNTAMRKIVYNVDNFRVHRGFKHKYPDLETFSPIKNRGTTDPGYDSGAVATEQLSEELNGGYPNGTLHQVNSSNIDQTVPSEFCINVFECGEAHGSPTNAPCISPGANWGALELEPVDTYEHNTFARNPNGVGSDIGYGQDPASSLWPNIMGGGSVSSTLADSLFQWDMGVSYDEFKTASRNFVETGIVECPDQKTG